MEDFRTRSTQPTAACSLSPATETKRELPAQLHQAISANGQNSECTIREEDQFVPIKNVIRIMRKILSPHAKIADDSKITIQECVSEFISFITCEANDHCHRDQLKTITTEDVIQAMSNLGFADNIEPLTLYLNRYRAYDGGKRESLRRKPLLLKHPIVHLPPNFQMAHHQYGYFVFPQVMCHGCMQGNASNVSTSQYAVVDVDSEVESPAKESNE